MGNSNINMGMTRYHVYLTINLEKERLFKETGNRRYQTTRYIGSKTFDDPNYFGSSVALKNDIKKYGKQNFQKMVICELLEKDSTSLIEIERQVQEQFDAVNSNLYYNKVLATLNFTSTGFQWFQNTNTGEYRKVKDRSQLPENWQWVPNMKAPNKGTVQYHHRETLETKFFNKDEKIDESIWIKGRGISTTKDKKWYCNPLTNERKLLAYKPEGWEDGMGEIPNHVSNTKVLVSYYDPITKINYRYEEGKQPSNLIRGRNGGNQLGKQWYHNPHTSERAFLSPDNEIPPGWIKGKGFVSGGRPVGSKNIRNRATS